MWVRPNKTGRELQILIMLKDNLTEQSTSDRIVTDQVSQYNRTGKASFLIERQEHV